MNLVGAANVKGFITVVERQSERHFINSIPQMNCYIETQTSILPLTRHS